MTKWVWRYYIKLWTDEVFSEIQTDRGRRGGKASAISRVKKNEEKRAKAYLLAAKGKTQRAIAKELEVSVGSIKTWFKS